MKKILAYILLSIPFAGFAIAVLWFAIMYFVFFYPFVWAAENVEAERMF